jgi:two-component system, OmpR family, sensor histidine kinase BaeS
MQLDELMHEMRNALAVVRANLEAFLDGKLSPTPERLEGMLQALTQLESLMGSFTVLGPQVQSRAQDTYINVCDVLNREYGAMSASAGAKDISLSITRCAVTSKECKHFYGEPVRIGQIIKNVLLNAIRYTPRGGSIDIDCSRRADQLEIRIQDSGPGIASQEADRIFEHGFRGSAAGSESGSGYGLALVKRFVEEQGGQVTLTSTSHSGAAFTLRLPGRAGFLDDNCAECVHAQSPRF